MKVKLTICLVGICGYQWFASYIFHLLPNGWLSEWYGFPLSMTFGLVFCDGVFASLYWATND